MLLNWNEIDHLSPGKSSWRTGDLRGKPSQNEGHKPRSPDNSADGEPERQLLKRKHGMAHRWRYLGLESLELGWSVCFPSTNLRQPVTEVVCNLLVAVWLSQRIKHSDDTNKYDQWWSRQEIILELTSEIGWVLRIAQKLQLWQGSSGWDIYGAEDHNLWEVRTSCSHWLAPGCIGWTSIGQISATSGPDHIHHAWNFC
jgi:hypothetical protein